jgi:outer membrane protein assembly factor BamA
MPPRTPVLLGSLVLFSCALPAQTLRQTFTPQQIVYKGAPDYNDTDLNAVLALKLGKPMATDDVDPGLQRLADTGLFADIHYTINSQALTFILTPQPAPNMLPAVYSNFVMFAPGELTTLVHAKVPLFTGKIPSAGSLQQTVQDALTAILKEKGIPDASVSSINSASSDVDFSISNPPVQVRSVVVNAVSPAAQAKVAEIQQAFSGNDYERGSEAAIRTRLLDAYHDLAFLDAEIASPVRSAPVMEPTRILVDLTTTADEGSQYRVAKVVFPVSSIVPEGDFAKAATIKPGDLASRIDLLSTSAHISRQFTRRGYMDAKISATQIKDATHHTVVYMLTAVPGEQFHLKSVKALNLNDQQQKEFDANWMLAPGSLYDEEYVTSFLHKNTALRSFQGYSATYKQIAYPDSHEVDLIISFVRGGVLIK